MDENQIKLYPSNWLYNAGVIGLLEVMEIGGEDIEGWHVHDGTVTIDKRLFEKSLDFYKKYHLSKGNKELPLIGKNRRYPNYLQKGEDSLFDEYVKSLQYLENRGLSCGLCYGTFSVDPLNFNEKTRKIGRL